VILECSASSLGVTTPESVEIEGPYLMGATKSMGSPNPEDLDAVSDQVGIVPLVPITGDDEDRRAIRLNLGSYLATRPQEAVDLIRNLEGALFTFKVTESGPSPLSRDVLVQPHFGFDPGYFLARMAMVPTGGTGLLVPERLPDFNLDLSLLALGGGPGTLGVQLTNRSTLVPLFFQDGQGGSRTAIWQLDLERENLDPNDTNIDMQSLGVTTVTGTNYGVEVSFCDSSESCITRNRSFLAPIEQ